MAASLAMTQDTVPETDLPSAEGSFKEPIRPWEMIFLAAFSISVLLAIWVQSKKAYFNYDELVTALLVSNPSFSEMWNTIRHGGEVNPPLFFTLEWLAARAWGTGEFALRAFSAVAMAMAGWVLYFTIRPLSGPRIAALSVALILGVSREVLGCGAMARYYGLLFLFVTLATYLAMRFNRVRPARKLDYGLVFLVHFSLAWLHLYGLVYSGVLLAATVAGDWLRGRLRWGLYGANVAAWATFLVWLPTLRQQLKTVSAGVFVPPGSLNLGSFLAAVELEIPLALVVFVIGLFAALSLIATRSRAVDEANSISAPEGWTALALAALALMAVPIGTWTASHFMTPPPYRIRYVFPSTAGWLFIAALALMAVHRLPALTSGRRWGVPPWCSDLVLIGTVGFCLGFQDLRAYKNPERAPTPYVDDDYGYKDLPMVFENSWPFVHRAVYSKGQRQYVMVIDHDAAEADPGWYTKNMEREFKNFAPRYQNAVVSYYNNLPDWPAGFLAVDDDYAKTWEWIFAHHPELKPQLLGTRMSDPELFGQQRIYLVQKASAAGSDSPYSKPNKIAPDASRRWEKSGF